MKVQAVALAPGITIGGDTFPLVAGPCVIESSDMLLGIAQTLRSMSHRLAVPMIFKASFDKANRSSLESFRGPGLAEGLRLLAEVKETSGLPLLTDVHEPAHCSAAAEICDVLQIPAFLCRQTDLLLAAAETGRAVAIKKGQFMAPEDMARAVEKVRSRGNDRVLVTERGTSFGYHNLVVDMRSFTILHDEGIAVLYDATHSLQLPGARARESGGDRRFARPLALAAAAAGADGLYMEVHPNPAEALSDRETQLDPTAAEQLVDSVLDLRRSLAAHGPLV